MDATIDYDTLDAALRRCGAVWDAAQSHGLLSGRLAVAGAQAGPDWLGRVLEGTDPDDALRGDCEELLGAVFESTHRQLEERLSGFEPLLPGDGDSAAVRAGALGHWCEGFLHGLVSGERDEVLKSRLSAEPLAGIIRDMLQMTRATVDEGSEAESDEAAYAELVEYLRVAAQLAYEELVDYRLMSSGSDEPAPVSEVLH